MTGQPDEAVDGDRQTCEAAATLLATIEVDGHGGAFREDGRTLVLLEPIADAGTGRVDLLVTVTPVNGRREALSHMALTLSPAQASAVTRFGRLDRHGQVAFTAVDRGTHRLRLRPAMASARGSASLSLLRVAFAADRVGGYQSLAFRSADGTVEGVVTVGADLISLTLPPPTSPVGDVVITPLACSGDGVAVTRLLVAQFGGGPSHLPATVNLPLSPGVDEVAVDVGAPFDPSGLDAGFVDRETGWKDLVDLSVQVAADRVDVEPWQRLAEDERVAAAVRDAVRAALAARQ